MPCCVGEKITQGSEILTVIWGLNLGEGEKRQTRCLTKLQQVTWPKSGRIQNRQ